MFEVGCKLESPCGHIGESNVFECRSFVGENIKIGSGCVIGMVFFICHISKTYTIDLAICSEHGALLPDCQSSIKPVCNSYYYKFVLSIEL